MHKASIRELKRDLLRRYYWIRGMFGLDTSQYGEYMLLRKLIREDSPRYLVDVGAYDGVMFSNSYPFIRRGWDALAIEPNPTIFRFLTRVHMHNQRVRCVNKACSDQTGVLPFFIGADGETSMNSTLCTDNNDHLNKLRGDKVIGVPVDILTNIFIEHQVPRNFTLLFIDAEGMDCEVLRGLDFDLFSPQIIVTEDYPLNAEKHAEKYRILRDNGYVFHVMVECNSVWLKPHVSLKSNE